MTDEKDQESQTKAVETETYTLDGKDARIELHEDGKIAVTLPEGLSQEARESYVNSLKQGSKLIASLNKKLYDANRAKENSTGNGEITELKKELAELKQKLTPDTKRAKTVWEELGLDSESDLKDFATEHPDAYLAKLNEMSMKQVAEQLEHKTHQNIAEQSLTAQMKAKGLDPVEVQRYAQYYEMPLTEKAIDLYVRDHSNKRDPVLDAQIKAQEHQIVFMDPQKRKANLSNLTKKDLRKLDNDSLDEIIKM